MLLVRLQFGCTTGEHSFLLEMPLFPFQSEIGNVRDSYGIPVPMSTSHTIPILQGILAPGDIS